MQFHAAVFVEVEEVVALQELVSELREGKAVARLAVEAFLHAVFRHHVVDGDMLSHHAGEVQEGEFLHPVIVVDHLRLVGSVCVEVQELGHLGLDGLLVVVKCIRVQQVSLLAFARGVTYHARGSTYQDEGLMAAALQVAQHHDATKVAYVERVCRGVSAQIGGDHLFFQQFFGARHDLGQHAAPFQFFYEILCHRYVFVF